MSDIAPAIPSPVFEATAPSGPPRRRGWRRMLAAAAVVLAGVAVAGYLQYRSWASPANCFERAHLDLRRGDLDSARAELIRLQGYPQYAPHRHFLEGAIRVQSRQFEEALREFDYCMYVPELHIQTLVLAGQALYELGRAGNAQSLWQQALTEAPETIDAHRWMGALFYDLGAMEQALVHLKRVADLDPQDPRPDRLMGLINKDYERPDVAVKHYLESLRRAPDQPEWEDIRLELAQCQLKLFDYPSALATLAVCSPTPQRYVLEAECSLSSGDRPGARRLIELARKQAPDDKDALLLLGRMQLEDGDIEQAVETFGRAVERHPKDYVVRFKLVQALRRARQEQAAQENERVAEELKRLWNRFSELHMKALSEPQNTDVRREIGAIALQLDRPELAKTWFQAVLAINPTDARALEELKKLP